MLAASRRKFINFEVENIWFGDHFSNAACFRGNSLLNPFLDAEFFHFEDEDLFLRSTKRSYFCSIYGEVQTMTRDSLPT